MHITSNLFFLISLSSVRVRLIAQVKIKQLLILHLTEDIGNK